MVKLQAGAFALVDAGTRAEVDGERHVVFDDDRKHVGIVDQAAFYAVPVFAAVVGLPRQVPCAHVEDIGVHGVNRQGFHFVNLGVPRRADQRPRCASVGAAEDAIPRSGKQHFRIRGRLSEGKNRLAAEFLHRSPAHSAIAAHPKAAIPLVGLPSAGKNYGGICGIDQDSVRDQVFRRVQLRQPMPRGAFIERFVDPAIGGAQVKMIRLSRNRGKRASISPRRTYRVPEPLHRHALRRQFRSGEYQ